jgi:hypothetical protein
MKKLFLIVAALLCSPTFAGEFTFLAGATWFGPADDGTYWNKNADNNKELTKTAFAVRYDTDKTVNGYSLGVQYTDFGTARMDAMASGRDAPDPGGYDPHTGSCIGPCAPQHRWVSSSSAQSVALFLTKQWKSGWFAEAGIHAFQIDTHVYVYDSCCSANAWGHNSKDGQYYIGPAIGAGYRAGHWSARWQAWQLESKDPIPSIFTGITSTLMLGYTF